MPLKAKKTYFIVQAGTVPKIGSIVLGSVILDPALPERAINHQIITLPKSIPIESGIPLKDWRWRKAPTSKIGGGIYAQFAGIVDGEISARKNDTAIHEYICKELETLSFEPTDDYIDVIKAIPEVQAKIIKREKLYGITGIKIAKGATVNEQSLQSLGFRFAAMVDLTAIGGGIPIKVGPKVEINNEDPEDLGYNVEENFVFAYRIEEIFYRWKSVRHRPYGKEGDLHGHPPKNVDSDSEDEEEEEDTIDNFDFDKPKDHEIPASVIKGMHTESVQEEDGEAYEVVLPKAAS